MELYNYELELPLFPDPDNKDVPDLAPVQKAWWAAIDLINKWKDQGLAPIKLTLEMRFMRGSSALLAPQGGNQWTCAIETGTMIAPNTKPEDWVAANQAITDEWMKVIPKDSRVRPRFHWAKEWEKLRTNWGDIKDKESIQYIKDDAFVVDGVNLIPKFAQLRKDLAVDPAGLFSNDTLDKIFDIKWNPDVLPAIASGEPTIPAFVASRSVSGGKKRKEMETSGSSPSSSKKEKTET
jgi:hypothetical protein